MRRFGSAVRGGGRAPAGPTAPTQRPAAAAHYGGRVIRPPATLGAIIRTPRQPYRVLAIAESVTWTLLIIGLILKYGTQTTGLGVSIAGPIHGFVFLAYAAIAVIVGVNQRWPLPLMAAAVASAVIPYATIPFDRYLEKRGLLDGGWRRERTADPRDDGIPSRLLRVLLGHPIGSTIAVLAAVALLFGTLLVVGPPVPGS